MGYTLRILRTLATVTVLAAQPSPPHPSVTHLLVMPAVVDVQTNSGNVGRDFVRIMPETGRPRDVPSATIRVATFGR